MHFVKISATGNDFIAIDNRKNFLNLDDPLFFSKICDRRMGIGADGVIILGLSAYDFSYTYLNSDGKIAKMCGNGARSIIKFAKFLGIEKEEYQFNVGKDLYTGGFIKDEIYVKLQGVTDYKRIAEDIHYLNTGVPHLVVFKEVTDIIESGKKLRKEYDANVNFVTKYSDNLKMRTYERGVEGETYSCGTGAFAVAYVEHLLNGSNLITLHTLGGKLKVDISSLKLSGEVNLVYQGELL